MQVSIGSAAKDGVIMAVNLAELIVACLLVDFIFRKWNIPGLVGMLLVGIVFGPYALNLLSPELAAISSDLRMIALITILLRAGFELSKDTLKKVGVRAALFSFVPAVFEGIAITFLGPWLLGLTYLESAILGSVIAAVSPAVVVPLMIEFIEQRKGTAKGIPTLILAASSLDDVFVIVIYSSLIGFYTGEKANLIWKISGIPISIVTGIVVGLSVGSLLHFLFRRFNPRATKRLLVVLGLAVFFTALEHRLEGIVPFASLLAVMAIGFVILEKSQQMAHELSQKLAKLWVFAEIILFALVGAKVNIHVAVQAGFAAALLIGLALIARSVGSYVCLLGSNLTIPERLFVLVAYLPKATVQAAIGGAPLLAMKTAGMDTGPGEVILAVAALSIILTAPLGAWAIRLLGNRILEQENLVEPDHVDPATAERDIMQRLNIGSIIDPDPPRVTDHDNLRQVLHTFAGCRNETLPVLDTHGVLLGLIHLADLKPVLTSTKLWQGLLARDVMRAVPGVVQEEASLLEAKDAFDTSGGEILPVVEENSGCLVGIVERHALTQVIEEKTLEWLGRSGKAQTA